MGSSSRNTELSEVSCFAEKAQIVEVLALASCSASAATYL